MSVVTYDGVTLPYPDCTRFDTSSVYDPSGTDRTLTKFDIQAQCVVSAAYLIALAPSLIDANTLPVTNDPADIMNLLRDKLLVARKRLSFKVNGVEMIPQSRDAGGNLLTGTVDAKNGPQPQSCPISQINANSFLLTYHIVAHYWENPSTGATVPITNRAGNPVLSNRWTETVDMDDCEYTTRTRTGTVTIRSDNAEGVTPDQLRSTMAVVGLPVGFLRQSRKYDLTADGLSLNYSLVDKEVFFLPPEPAFRAEGEFTVSVTKQSIMHMTCAVRLRGTAQGNQANLLRAAISACTQKITKALPKPPPVNNPALQPANVGIGNAIGAALNPRIALGQIGDAIGFVRNMVESRLGLQANPLAGYIMMDFTAVLGMYDNTASCSIQVLTAPPTEPTPEEWAGNPLSEGVGPPEYHDRGTADLLLQAAAYYDPSVRGTVLAGGVIRSGNNPRSPEGTDSTQLSAGKQPGQVGKDGE